MREGFAYGYRKLTIQLRRDHQLVISKKKVYRLCKEMDLLRPQREKRISYPRKLARNRIITASNQLWEMDVKYGYIEGEERFFFVLTIIDVYDRSVIDYHIGLSCSGSDAVKTLQRALFKRQQFEQLNRPVIRTDNGEGKDIYEVRGFWMDERDGTEHVTLWPLGASGGFDCLVNEILTVREVNQK
jgi:putative transposase